MAGVGLDSVLLHPLVIINISDHSTRAKVNLGYGDQVIGVLLGNQNGKQVELVNSFELLCSQVGEITTVDEKFLLDKLSQFAEVFPDQEMLGWYAAGSTIEPSYINIHKQLMVHNESPLFVLLDVQRAALHKDLPVTVYESKVEIVNDQPEIKLEGIPYKIETSEAERIAVDHIAHSASSTGLKSSGESSIAQLSGTEEAIKMLTIRIDILIKFLNLIKNGEIQPKQEILRQIKSACHMLPAIDTKSFKTDLLQEYHDSLLITYLASITKTVNEASKVSVLQNFMYDKPQKRFSFFQNQI